MLKQLKLVKLLIQLKVLELVKLPKQQLKVLYVGVEANHSVHESYGTRNTCADQVYKIILHYLQ